jgi:hypothetical protein
VKQHLKQRQAQIKMTVFYFLNFNSSWLIVFFK